MQGRLVSGAELRNGQNARAFSDIGHVKLVAEISTPTIIINYHDLSLLGETSEVTLMPVQLVAPTVAATPTCLA